MSVAEQTASGKGRATENFPVASRIIGAPFRPAILAFYRFARAADDIADHGGIGSGEKLRRLDIMAQALNGEVRDEAAESLCAIAQREHLDLKHARDLLAAFRQDATKTRYGDFAELMDYCANSAMPVGRFVLDVHGEDRATWPASDALCAALQILNHLQDCADDYAVLDRVYLPLDYLAASGCEITALTETSCSPALRRVIDRLLDDTASLLEVSRPLARQVRNERLKFEVAVIQSIAERLTRRLRARDPLAVHVKLSGPDYALCLGGGLWRWVFAR